MRLLFTNKSCSKMLSTHLYKGLDALRKCTMVRKQPTVRDHIHPQAHPWSAFGRKCLPRSPTLPRVPPDRASPEGYLP